MSAPQDRMKVGLDIPLNDRTGLGWKELRDIAIAAEDAGFDSIWVDDHLLYHYEGNAEPNGNRESWAMLTAIAAHTKTVELGHLVLGMGFRNPALLAKIADTVDEISEGRLILGLGAGYHKREYTAFGFPYDNRFKRFEEALQIVHGLLRNGHIDFEGDFYSARDCILRPRGGRPEGPPIMIGTTGHKMLRLTAKYADMWNSYWTRTNNSPSGVAPLRAMVDEACEEVGRDPTTLQRSVSVLTAESNENPWWEALPTSHDYEPFAPLSGGLEEIAEGLRAYRREGIDHMQISVDNISTGAIERLGPALELLRKSY